MTTSAPQTGACAPWATSADLPRGSDSLDLPDGMLESCLQMATDFLFLRTGRQWPGVCGPITVRPCARQSQSTIGALLGGPVPIGGGSWSPGSGSDWGFCGCNREVRSGCSSLPEITLGRDVVAEIEEVVVDGVVLDPSLYRVDDFRWLVRLRDEDGNNPGWRCCQRMELPLTHEQTWGVAFKYGSAPPAGGKECAALLAVELAKAFDPTTDPKTCSLPNRVVSVARQGVTMQMLNPLEVLQKGLTGIYFIDQWITSKNPHGLARRSTVSSPDVGRRVRRAGTWTP